MKTNNRMAVVDEPDTEPAGDRYQAILARLKVIVPQSKTPEEALDAIRNTLTTYERRQFASDQFIKERL